ncbi:MAG: GntR family transcriptional regulator [Pollutimonas bauzanensis]|uniref:DNA-binding transcriptional regulator, GntR family n=1 Tax=Pollutimonas bauzanensis TaxID=658167 RepID=A0A1M5TF16_9BURK|nr:GntR family transcriptional regulator [Pollutimonas bauzanensis]SHH48933.1 DNA-binding transcriptional regulator, GntR family [Pollutimonas bauzanensis]
MSPSVPIYRQIQDFIRGGIAAGHFMPGDRLPSEFELARRFGTTRATVARAFQELGFEGLVSRRVGSGTYVSERQRDNVDTGVVGGYEERATAAGQAVSYELLEYARTEAGQRVADMLQVAPGAAVYRIQRLRRVGGRIAAEDRYVPEAIGQDIQPDWLAQHAVQHLFREYLGLRIARIDNVVRATLATASLSQRLSVERGAALLVREHIIFDLQDRPVLCGDTVYSSEFSIHYALRAAQ